MNRDMAPLPGDDYKEDGAFAEFEAQMEKHFERLRQLPLRGAS